MRKLFLFLLIAMTIVKTYAQEKEYNYNDGYFVAYLSETNDKSIKCDVYPSEVSEADVQKLIDNGRFITSVIYTKDGGIILHKKNTEGIKQIYLKNKYNMKKVCKQKFKEGYVLNYYNNQRGYAIFNRDTKAKTMKFISTTSFDQKKLSNLNKKGLFVKFINTYTYVAYDGQDNIKEQTYVFGRGNDRILENFKKSSKTHFLYSAATLFNPVGNMTYYKYISNTYKNRHENKQDLAIFESVENFKKYLKGKKSTKLSLAGLWGGWQDTDYKAAEARAAAADNSSIFDILGGLANSIGGLTGHKAATAANGANINTTTPNGSAKNSAAGKCRRCQGSGKCSPTSGSSRKSACHGSGLCGFCNGTGWNNAGASRAICTACNGKKKCKTCKGTGNCPVCHGSGK